MRRTLFGLSGIGLMLIISCTNLDTVNTNSQPGDESAEVLEARLQTGYNVFFSAILSPRVVVMDIQSDIMSSQIQDYNFLNHAAEPRVRLNNESAGTDQENIENIWNASYSAIFAANRVLAANEPLIIDRIDETERLKAAANLLKGLAYGYLGYVYDKAVIIESAGNEFSPYDEVTNEGVKFLNEAISMYDNNAELTFDFINEELYNATYTSQIANSFAARFLIGVARTDVEAQFLDYTAIKDYASKGITTDWSPISTQTLYNGQHLINTFQSNEAGDAYIPVDLQVLYLFSLEGDGPEYPKTHPGNGEFLEEVSTNDNRIQTDFEYKVSSKGPKIGFESLYSRYRYKRFEYDYQFAFDGNPMHIIRAEEMILIQAEAEMRTGNFDEARTLLNSGNRVARGGLPALTDEGVIELERILWYENIIELHSGGAGVSLAYMRRWNRLQPGSYLHFPVPAQELLLLDEDLYSFGGFSNAGENGTAAGTDSWK